MSRECYPLHIPSWQEKNIAKVTRLGKGFHELVIVIVLSELFGYLKAIYMGKRR